MSKLVAEDLQLSQNKLAMATEQVPSEINLNDLVFVDVDHGLEHNSINQNAEDDNLESVIKLSLNENPEKRDIVSQSLYKAICEDSHTSTAIQVKPKPSSSSLQIQFKIHKCPECNCSWHTEYQLNQHIRKIHRQETPFLCSMCKYTTRNKTLFNAHLNMHNGVKPYNCSACPYSSVSKKGLDLHSKIHRSDNPLKCHSCPFIAKHGSSLKAHNCKAKKVKAKKTKNGAKWARLFNCVYCEWRSSSKTKILLHLVHHPNQKPPKGVDVAILRKYGIMKG